MTTTLRRILLSRWTLSLLGTLLLAVLVWLFAPLLAPFEGVLARLALVLAMLLLWAGVNLWLDRRRRGRDAALAGEVAGANTAADASAAASAEESAAQRAKLAQALALLRRASGTRGYLYEQPWYVIIGPPGAGKTTALLNAGLRFPLAAELGQAPVAGVGGTRLCEWWFTEQAVLIDTAGRYTTQDSDAAVDRAGWTGFLDLLRRTRPRQPLNGVLVAIALTDIATAPRAERSAHAHAIRRRIKELNERLGLRLPVYAIFTKADLLAGFSEFFDDLDAARRAQVWGHTAALDTAGGSALAAFPAAFQALLARLGERLLDRLQAERGAERRALIAGFPAQVASLQAPLEEFLNEAFAGSRLDPAPLLRGLYITSGTQEGTPIDRLTGVLARGFGLDQRRAASLRPQQGRSYFLHDLLTRVVFGEAMLVASNPAAARRRRWLRAGGMALAAVAVLLGSAALWRGEAANQAAIGRLQAALAAYTATAQGLPLDPVAEADLARVLPLLDAARGLTVLAAADPGPSFGLSQRSKLAAGAGATYRHALQHVLLPRLIWRLETQMRGGFDRPAFLYEATRVYLMLGGEGPLDADLVRAWMSLDWQASYPGPAQQPLREALARHLDALLAEPLPAIALDGALVAQARTVFSRVPLAERVYSRLKPAAEAAGLVPWTPATAIGPAGVGLFLRASGKPLSAGISGFYTLAGFQQLLLPALGRVSRDVAAESWVLGERARVAPGSPELAALEQGVVALYSADFIAQWDAMLADLDLAPMHDLGDATRRLYLLGAPQSPMRDLLASVAREVSLAPPAAPATPGKPALAAAAAQLQGLLASPAGAAAPLPGQAVMEHFKALRGFAGAGSPAPIDGVLALINDLQKQLAQLAQAPPGTPPPPPSGADPAQLLLAEAALQPQPVARWMQQIASIGNMLRGGGARQAVAGAFNGTGGPAQLCRQAVAGRYPFDRGARDAIPLDDFVRLFAPGGLLDGFFNTQLRQYVDMAPAQWRPQPVNGVAPPVSAAALAQFQRAATIRDAFFSTGTPAPSVRFDLTPLSLDAGARQVTLDLGGVSVSYANGPTRATQIAWPGGGGNARLAFDPPPTSGPGALEASGPWALFRLLDQAQVQQQGAPDRYQVSFALGERRATFEIHAGSVFNPFIPGLLAGFRCPALGP